MWNNPVSDWRFPAPSCGCWLLYISCPENESNNLFKWFPIQVPQYECAHRIISWMVCMILSPLNWFSSFFILIFLWCFYNSSRFCFSVPFFHWGQNFLLNIVHIFCVVRFHSTANSSFSLPQLSPLLSCSRIRFICFCVSTCVFVQFFCLTALDLLLWAMK